MGLVAAIRAWQAERGPFPAFADRCVSNHALLALQAAFRRKHQLLTRAVSLDSPQRPGAADDPEPDRQRDHHDRGNAGQNAARGGAHAFRPADIKAGSIGSRRKATPVAA